MTSVMFPACEGCYTPTPSRCLKEGCKCMRFDKIPTSGKAIAAGKAIEFAVNQVVRQYDNIAAKLHLGGRAAAYDDSRYEFIGGAQDNIRKKHYDKSLRLLWKAEEKAPWLGFKDCTAAEKHLSNMAMQSMSQDERDACRQITLPEFKKKLRKHYSPKERSAIVNILATIGHGEAYAWLVSSSLLSDVKSTGARTALTMQVLEEAKHFVVLRELLYAFDVDVPRQSVWEYILLENVLKAKGLEKFFGMNILVEGIALSFFGLMSTLPGLEILQSFHLDESRHTALPGNYLQEFPLTSWQKISPRAQWKRLRLILPALALIPNLEEHMAELGFDTFEFGGSTVRKISILAQRNGFFMLLPPSLLFALLDTVFNAYCQLFRQQHQFQRFTRAESTRGSPELGVEKKIFLTHSA